MKFQTEDKYKIKINKYNKKDLILTAKGIWFIGSDNKHSDLRLPKREYKKVFIIPNQVSEYGEYLYIPNDQVPKDDNIYTYPKPVESKIIEKFKWLGMKNKYPYKNS